MTNQKSTPAYIKDGILFTIAIFIALVIYVIDVNVSPSIGIGSIYCLVILYSWIFPGKNISIYIGFLCTILIIMAMVKKSESIPQGSLEGLNTFIAIIVVWICVTLVSAAKSGFAGMEKVLESLEDKVRQRTQALTKSREELEVSERVYRYLYENSNEMHASVHLEEFHILRSNDTLCKKTGYSKEELLNKPIEIIHHPNSKQKLNESLQDFRERGFVKNANLKLRTKSGKDIDVILNVTSAKNEKGEITDSRFSWTDITELKRIENERIAYAEKLEIKNKELEQFVFIASHDLQEPLRTITSFSELLIEEYHEKFDETGKDSLNFIIHSTARMRTLVKGLLDYGRIGKDSVMMKVDVSEIINDLKKDLSLKIAETNTTIEYNNLPDFVMGYKSELRQLFQNLILNSIKFSKLETNPKIKITAVKENGGLLFCIEDNGIGISEKHHNKIFKIFKRLHTSSEYEGTGIGLAHCYKIVDIHGGKIWVESELGKGSKFYFTIIT